METTKRLVKYAAAILMLASASFATQAETFDAKQVSVRAYDLDLNKPADAQTLLNRVRHATRDACRRSGDSRDFQTATERARCERESYARSLAAIENRTGLDIEAVAALGKRVPGVASK